MDYRKWAEENRLVYLVSGSRLYGTANEDSDYDYRGVCYMPQTVLLGMENFEQYENKSPDVVIYGLRKFFQLAVQNNPNIMDILFAPTGKWVEFDFNWKIIYDNRHLFLSQLIRKTFVGYAISQMKRMKTHRAWLLNPPEEPQLENYGCWLYGEDNGAQKIGYEFLSEYNCYNNAKLQWDNYNEWLKTRNPKRLIMEQKVGYDTKNAGHLMRLLRGGRNILETCDYNPELIGQDLKFVKEVMAGLFDYDNLIILAEEYITIIDEQESKLQKLPDYNNIQELLMGINYNFMKWSYGSVSA